MTGLLRRIPWPKVAQAVLLLLALNGIVTGFGSVVRGAETSAFLPAAVLAGLLGWGMAYSRLKDWQGQALLTLLGAAFLWGYTAQLGVPLLRSLNIIGGALLQDFLRLHGSYWINNSHTQAEAAIRALLAQSAAVWVRLEAWLAGIRAGQDVDDPVARVLVWSLLVWLLAGWAGWQVSRNKPLEGLAPGLVVLAWLIKYTNASASGLLLLAVCMLGLLSQSRFDANLRRWAESRLDYAEAVISNTLFAGVFLTVSLGALGFSLPSISIKDVFESFRRQQNAENQAARSLGLEAPQQPTPPAFRPVRPPGLPNTHLLGGSPELSKDVIFTVRTGELSPMPVTSGSVPVPRHYWRSYSFDIYNGSGWYSSRGQNARIPAEEPLYGIPPGYTVLTQNFELKHGDEGALYWSGSLYRSNLPFEAAWRSLPGGAVPQTVDPFQGADLFGALNSSPAYQVESLIPQASEEQLRAAGRDIPAFIRDRYTSLPGSVPERVFALARQVTATSANPYDEARAIETYLRASYPYTLDVPLPPLNADVADYFLFDLKKGYCDYYATAMVVMARSVGLPARLVMGYATGTYNPTAAEYTVTAADAHAWVEVFFPGFGWVEFEPTAGQPEIRRELQANVPAETQPEAPQPWNGFFRSVYALPAWSRWIIFGAAGILGLASLLFLAEGWLLDFARPAFALRWMYRSVYRQAARLSGKPFPGQTAIEFSNGLQDAFDKPDAHLERLTALYMRSLFSPGPLNRSELHQAILAWRGLRWKLLFARKRK